MNHKAVIRKYFILQDELIKTLWKKGGLMFEVQG